MHVFFFLRGIDQFVELYKSHLQGLYWKWTRIDLKTNKPTDVLVQGALRPSFLGAYEYVFPEEALSEVIAVLGLQEDKSFRMNVIRKLFGLKKIPKKNFEEAKKIKTDIFVRGTWRGLSGIKIPGAGAAQIGMKKDKRGEMYGFIQEGL